MADVAFDRRSGLAIATLDRPKVLNTLTLDMCRMLHRELEAWREDPAVHALLLRGNGRAFCAGGDVRRIYDARGSPLVRGDYKYDMFFEEYFFIRDLHRFPKPTIALTHGITMGGGMGLSVNGTFCVATESSVFAMPEIFIGSLPDVGALRFFNFCPGEIGTWLALTGARVGAADALYCRFATHFVGEARFGELTEALSEIAFRGGEERAQVAEVLGHFASSPGEATLPALQPAIDRCFSRRTVAEIMAALSAEDGPWAKEALSSMRRGSPLSLKATLRAVREGKGSTIEEALQLEFRVIQNLLEGDDFYEGVRAVLVDKDRNARWRFASPAEVSDAEVERQFRSLGDRELRFG